MISKILGFLFSAQIALLVVRVAGDMGIMHGASLGWAVVWTPAIAIGFAIFLLYVLMLCDVISVRNGGDYIGSEEENNEDI